MTRCGLALLASLALVACHRAPQLPPPAPALWEVTGTRGERGWLFGTIHALPDGAKWDTPKLEDALKHAGLLVVEVANLRDMDAARRAFEAVAYSPGLPPLLQRLPPAERPQLAAALKRAGLKERDFADFESWAAALTIASAENPDSVDNGVDQALLQRRMPVMGLEGFAEQFAIFDRLSQAQQATLLHFATAPEEVDDEEHLTAAWLKGDLRTLDREASASELSDAGLRQALLIQRNRAWAQRIAGLLQQHRRPFVAVGAGHMLQDVGLPALLAKQGYTVRRIQ